MGITGKARKILVVLTTSVTTLVIGWIDYLTGNQSDVFVFYYFPVAIAAWQVGALSGLFVSVLAAGGWLVADILVTPGYSWSVEAWDTSMRLASFLMIVGAVLRIKRDMLKQRALNNDLARAMEEIKQLTGTLPMCNICRRVRTEKDQWVTLDQYISSHSEAEVSHTMCPRCYKRHYGQPDGT